MEANRRAWRCLCQLVMSCKIKYYARVIRSKDGKGDALTLRTVKFTKEDGCYATSQLTCRNAQYHNHTCSATHTKSSIALRATIINNGIIHYERNSCHYQL